MSRLNNIRSDSSFCRICGAPVSEHKSICECCEDSFALCDIEDYLLQNSRERSFEKGGETLLKTVKVW